MSCQIPIDDIELNDESHTTLIDNIESSESNLDIISPQIGFIGRPLNISTADSLQNDRRVQFDGNDSMISETPSRISRLVRKSTYC